MNAIDLKGRSAIVTGGAQGIGRAVAERLLASGAAVALWDRDGELLAGTARQLADHGEVSTADVDVTDAEAVAGAFAASVERHGAVDVMVNNAGIAGPTMPSWEYPLDEWRAVVDVDLNGVYYCCRAALPHMRERDYGRIVNVASIAAVIALTKSLAKETAARNIAVNCITPAAAKTRIFDQISRTHIDYMLAKIPRGRFLAVDEAAAMVAWMVSEENSFTTGAVFDLSGGRATY